MFVRQYFNGDSAKMGHWLDTEYEAQMAKLDFRTDLTPSQILEAKDNMQNKWRGRPIPGDIIEVREDGWWDSKCLGPRSWMPLSYACVKIPGVKPVKYLADAALDVDGKCIYGHRNTVDNAYRLGEATIEPMAVIRDKLAQVVANGGA